MAVDWGINKASEIGFIHNMIEGIGNIISNKTARYTIGEAVKIAATHLIWNGIKKPFTNND